MLARQGHRVTLFSRALVFDVIHCHLDGIHLPLARAGTVHHGLPLELHCPHYDAGGHLVFLGLGFTLKIAVKIAPAAPGGPVCTPYRNREVRWWRRA